MDYILKNCSLDEYPLLIEFIDKYWKKNHIFVLSKEMFDFQHFNKETNEYEFAIGINPETSEIDGICGIIPLSHYDPELAVYNETWGGIWKTRDDVKNDGIGLLGLELFEFFNKYTSHGGFGMSKIAYRFFKRKGYKMCTLNQYYILNDGLGTFNIAKVTEIEGRTEEFYDNSYTIEKIDNIEDVNFSSIDNCYWPRKSLTYLVNRFKNHPVYNYLFYGLYNNKVLRNIFVIRKCYVKESNVLRIVDVIGNLDNTPYLRNRFQKMLKEHNSEYIDLMNYGVSQEVFINMGFRLLNPMGSIIIPNYFEPFEQRNVVLEGAYRSPHSYTFFRADADQDRPNILPKK